MTDADPFATHEVFNQSPVFEGVNLFTSDRALGEAVAREGAGWAADELAAAGAALGSAETIEHGRLANENPPVLKLFDAKGRRLDAVEFHPSYHALMALTMGHGSHCGPWEHLATGGRPRAGATVARAAKVYMTNQVEAGHHCPITMTHAVVPTLLFQEDLAKEWIPRIAVRRYDPAFRPAADKASVTFGMGMTEKQGGTDVRANATTAEPTGDGAYRLVGHKWFLSAPMSDAFLMLAQAPGGLSCFLVPRFLPDGTVNPLRLQRLKPKVGNRSNASSEVELPGTHGWLIGEEGRGVRTIIEMATYTRFDCALSSAGMMRMALAQCLNHVAHRTVFQKKLIDQPMMRRVLADMALEVEAATALTMRLGRAYDRALPTEEPDPSEAAYKRIMTPAAKYWVCKAGPAFAYEAMETLGGNGYVEDGLMGRIYREMPVNAIWEGSGNVMCLDVLRAIEREPEAADALVAGFETGGEPRLAAAVGRLRGLLAQRSGLEARARLVTELLVAVAAGTLLQAHAPAAVADGFLATRLAPDRGRCYGALETAIDETAILERAMPVG